MDVLKSVFNKRKTTGLPHFIRYAFVSGIALATDVGLLIVLHGVFGLHYLAAATLGFVCGVIVNYLLSIAWVFSASRFNNRTIEFLLTAGFAAVGLVINDFFMWVTVDVLAASYLTAKCAASLLVFIWNFVARQYYVHAAPSQKAARPSQTLPTVTSEP